MLHLLRSVECALDGGQFLAAVLTGCCASAGDRRNPRLRRDAMITMGDMLVLAICKRFVATVATVVVYAARIMLG